MNNRQERINNEVKRELASIIKGLKDPRIPLMTSVIAAHVTKDFKHAKVYVSIMGNENVQDSAINAIASASSFIRRELGGRLDLRSIPELHFELDKSIEHGAKINKIINDLNKNGE